MEPATTALRSVRFALLGLAFTACFDGGQRSVGADATSPQQAPVAAEQALIVTLKLSDGAFGAPAEREAMFALENELEREIARTGAGEFDGNEFGGGTCVFYMYGADADKLEAAVAPILRRSAVARGAQGVKRYGGPGDPAVRTTIVQY